MKKRILIIDDEEYLASFYSLILVDQYDIVVVASGKDALRKMTAEENIDMVLLDYKLPDMSGLEVLKEIKKLKPSVPLIVVTAFGDEDIAVQSFRYGARDYIKKPFCGSHLIKKIEFYISLSSADANLARKSSYCDPDTELQCHTTETSLLNYYNIQKTMKYIDENLMVKISLDTVAKKTCMSKAHFCRTFKKVTGTTYINYTHQRRVEKSKEILKNSTLTITDIALLLGYADLTHFERHFKKLVNVTPTEYRQFEKKAIIAEKKEIIYLDATTEH